MTRDRRQWTLQERDYLLSRWGLDTPTAIGKALGRSPGAVVARAFRREDLGSPARGLLSLAEVCRRLGYCPPTVRRAAHRAGLTLRHPPSAHPDVADRAVRYGIDEELLPALVRALEVGMGGQRWSTRRGEWGTGCKPDACRSCGRSDRPHLYRGLCKTCVERHRCDGTLSTYPTIRGDNRTAWRRASS